MSPVEAITRLLFLPLSSVQPFPCEAAASFFRASIAALSSSVCGVSAALSSVYSSCFTRGLSFSPLFSACGGTSGPSLLPTTSGGSSFCLLARACSCRDCLESFLQGMTRGSLGISLLITSSSELFSSSGSPKSTAALATPCFFPFLLDASENPIFLPPPPIELISFAVQYVAI